MSVNYLDQIFEEIIICQIGHIVGHVAWHAKEISPIKLFIYFYLAYHYHNKENFKKQKRIRIIIITNTIYQ